MSSLWNGVAAVLIYFIVAASTAFICRCLIRIPDEIFRKGLHFILLGSYIPFVFAFEVWWHAALFAVALEIAIYPIVCWCERFERFSGLVTERKHGEFKKSLLLAFTMLAVCMAVCWGWMKDRYLVLAAMYAWGVGDAFAALIGKAYGKHKIQWKFADHHKSWEGSGAMFAASTLAVLTVLCFRGGLAPAGYAVIPLAAAGVSTLVELVTPDGYDTITCPTAALVVILPLMAWLGEIA